MLKTNLHMLVYTIKIRLIMISTEHRMTFLLNLIDITCWHCHSAHCDDRKHKALLKVYLLNLIDITCWHCHSAHCDDRKHKALLKVYHTIIQSEAN